MKVLYLGSSIVISCSNCGCIPLIIYMIIGITISADSDTSDVVFSVSMNVNKENCVESYSYVLAML